MAWEDNKPGRPKAIDAECPQCGKKALLVRRVISEGHMARRYCVCGECGFRGVYILLPENDKSFLRET